MAPPSRRDSTGSGPMPPHPGSRRPSFASPQRPGGGSGTPSNVPLPSSRRPSVVSPQRPGPDTPGSGPPISSSRHGTPGSGPPISSSRRPSFASPQRPGGGSGTPSNVPLPTSRRPSVTSPQRPGPGTPGSGPPTSSSRRGTLGSGPPFLGNQILFPNNRPLSDAELIAAFTPEEKRFYAWFQKTEETRNQLMDLESDFGAYGRFVKEQWPNKKEYLAYKQWVRKWLGRHKDRLAYRMSDKEFFDQLRNANFTRKGDLAQLGWTLNMCNVPMVILGETTFDGVFTCFAVQPSSNFLCPSPSLGESTLMRDDLTHETALAINFKVRVDAKGFPSTKIRDVKKAIVSTNGQPAPDSVDPNATKNPKDKARFVFAQLGELCFFVGDWKTARTKSRDDIVGGTWQTTGFGVVAEVSPKGVPHALWAIFNTQLPVGPLGDKTNRTHDLGGSLGGWIFKDPSTGSTHSTKNRFFVARIADNLMDFGPSKKLNFEIVSNVESLITRAMVYEPLPGKSGIFPMVMEDTKASK